MQETNAKYLMINENVYIDKMTDSPVIITVEAPGKEAVNELTLGMIEMGFDVLYEPRKNAETYESCVICEEKLYIKIVEQKKEEK
ncbi:MAG: hypothetical protein NC429_06025 [Lachnospiraceae bacterium]|nr:hypothetical protein [Lachnospiraceae bacterium]